METRDEILRESSYGLPADLPAEVRRVEERSGSRVRWRFECHFPGWEVDEFGYVMEDGTVWWTESGSPHVMTEDDIVKQLAAVDRMASDLTKALQVCRAAETP